MPVLVATSRRFDASSTAYWFTACTPRRSIASPALKPAMVLARVPAFSTSVPSFPVAKVMVPVPATAPDASSSVEPAEMVVPPP